MQPTMSVQLCPNDGIRIAGIQAIACVLLLIFSTYVNCNNHHSIMIAKHSHTTAVLRIQNQSAAKAAKISQHQLHPQMNLSSP
jgi:hypothetical protein